LTFQQKGDVRNFIRQPFSGLTILARARPQKVQQMEFNWDDLKANSVTQIKAEAKRLGLELPAGFTESDLIAFLASHRDFMQLTATLPARPASPAATPPRVPTPQRSRSPSPRRTPGPAAQDVEADDGWGSKIDWVFVLLVLVSILLFYWAVCEADREPYFLFVLFLTILYLMWLRSE
jgi:hypothetical protein